MKLNTFRPFRPFNRLDASPSLTAAVKSLAAKYNGMLWDPQSYAGLYQDSAGTVPVTAVGQPVGRMLPASAAGAVFAQATTTKRPTLQQTANGSRYLQFDGVDDGMVTAANVDLTATRAISVGVAMQYVNGPTGILIESSPVSGVSPGSFRMSAPNATSSGNANFVAGGTSAVAATVSAPADTPCVLTGVDSIATPAIALRLNGVQLSSSAATQGTGNFGSYPLFLGSRNNASLFLNGRIYRAGLFPVQLEGSELKLFEQWLAQPLGVTIP